MYIGAYGKKKSTQQPPEIQMASNTDIKIITGIKLKYLFEKINEYGTNHMFQLLDEAPLKELIELGKDLEKPIWEYNCKYYLEINAVRVKEAQVENGFNKGHPYIMDLTFSKYDFQKNWEQITDYSISEINILL